MTSGEIPLRLWELHRASTVGDVVPTAVVASIDDPRRRADLIEGGGFESVADDRMRRLRTLADTVAPGLRLLVVGLNPSLYAADAGIGFARPGNRFWPAALAAGIVTRDRDPLHTLTTDHVGMTDLVKRATVRADELAGEELVAGFARLDRLCTWLRPASACVLGISGWRVAVGDRRATIGWQPTTFGPTAVYVMPNPSGLNARVPPAELAEHLRTAAAGPAA